MSRAVQPSRLLPKQMPCLASGRSSRVIALVLTIVLLSLADLYITLMYLHSGGMGEANPLARWIMGHGSPALLVAWKTATVAVASLLLYRHRRNRTAEFGAWVCLLILVWLTMRWAQYSDEVHRLTPQIHTIGATEQTRWVTMTPTP